MTDENPYQTFGAALQAVIEHAVTTALASVPAVVPGEPVMLSVPAAAEQLGVGTTKLKQLIASGQLASVTIGRRRLIPSAGLQAWPPVVNWTSPRQPEVAVTWTCQSPLHSDR